MILSFSYGDEFMFLEEFICECFGSGVPVKVANVIRIGYNIIRIAVPIILIIIGMIDMAKAVTGKDEAEIKKAQNLLVKRGIAAALVFLMLSLVTMLVSATDSDSEKDMSCLKCILGSGSSEGSGGGSNNSGGNNNGGSSGGQTNSGRTTKGYARIYFSESSYKINYGETKKLILYTENIPNSVMTKNTVSVSVGSYIQVVDKYPEGDHFVVEIKGTTYKENRSYMSSEVVAYLNYEENNGKQKYNYTSNKVSVKIGGGTSIGDVNITEAYFVKAGSSYTIDFSKLEKISQVELKPLDSIQVFLRIEPDEIYSVNPGDYIVEDAKNELYSVKNYGGNLALKNQNSTFTYNKNFAKTITVNKIGNVDYNVIIKDAKSEKILVISDKIRLNVTAYDAGLYLIGSGQLASNKTDSSENYYLSEGIFYNIRIKYNNQFKCNSPHDFKIYGRNDSQNPLNIHKVEKNGEYCVIQIRSYMYNRELNDLVIEYDDKVELSSIKGNFYFLESDFASQRYVINHDSNRNVIVPVQITKLDENKSKIEDNGKTAIVYNRYDKEDIARKFSIVNGYGQFQINGDALELTWPTDYEHIPEYEECWKEGPTDSSDEDDKICWERLVYDDDGNHKVNQISLEINGEHIQDFEYTYYGFHEEPFETPDEGESVELAEGEINREILRINVDTGMPMIYFLTSSDIETDRTAINLSGGKNQYYFLNIFASFREDYYDLEDTDGRGDCTDYTIELSINGNQYNVRFREYFAEDKEKGYYYDLFHRDNLSWVWPNSIGHSGYEVHDGLNGGGPNTYYSSPYLAGTDGSSQYQTQTLANSDIFNDSIDTDDPDVNRLGSRKGLCYAYVTSMDPNAFSGVEKTITLSEEDKTLAELHDRNLEKFKFEDGTYNFTIRRDIPGDRFDPDTYLKSFAPWIQEDGIH